MNQSAYDLLTELMRRFKMSRSRGWRKLLHARAYIRMHT